MACHLVTNRFLELSYEESLLFPHKSNAPILCFLTFGNNLLPGKYLFPLPGNSFPISGLFQILPYTRKIHFSTSRELHVYLSWEMTCDLVTNRFLELSYEESLLFLHKSNAPILCFLTFGNKLLPGKYLFPLPTNSFPLPWQFQILPYTRKIPFSISGELHVSLSWKMTCDLVTNRFLELSYEECLLFPHESTTPMIYILTFKNNLLPSKYLFPTSGKLVSTSWAISSIIIPENCPFPLLENFLFPLLEEWHVS